MASTSSAELPAVTSPIFTKRFTTCTHISPAHLVQPLEGVREQLNRSMLRYVEQLGGVLIHYSGLRFTQPLGRISGDQPEVHVRVSFNATYFAPKVGDYLDGTVSRIGGDHIALLVLGVFNGSVAHPTGARRGQIKQDDKGVVFVVRNVTHANGLISMHGSAPPPKREREGEEAAEAAGGNGGEKGTKHRHTPEEREAKKRRKAEREAARKLAEA